MPHAVDLTTLTDLKNYISPSLGASTASDAILSKIITAVSSGINRYVSRTLAFDNFTEIRNGQGIRSIRTLVYPIINVNSAQQGQSAVSTTQSVQVSVNGETPSGLLNSTNQVFNLEFLPTNPQAVQFFYNGLLQDQGADYEINGGTITFLLVAPEPDATLQAFYSYTSSQTVMALPPGYQTLSTTNDKWFIYADRWFFECGRQNVLLNYAAGFITPGQLQLIVLPAWSGGTLIAPSSQIQSGGFYFQSINGGTTGASLPTFLTARNGLTNDNGIIWRCQGAIPILPPTADIVPDDFQEACIQQSALLFKNRTRVGDTGTGVGPDRVNYFTKDAHPSTLELLKRHREVFPTDGMGTV